MTKKRLEIEALRAVAVMAVIFSHLGLLGFKSGYLGVDVFFVISGYLITGLLLKEEKISLKLFYARRVKRIIPLATLVLITTYLIAKVILPASSLGSIYDDLGWSSIFLMNTALLERSNDYFQLSSDSSFFQHYWSLAVEEQFYFFYPLILILLIKFKSKKVLLSSLIIVVLVSCGYWINLTINNPTQAYYSTFGRIWELGTGAIVLVAFKTTKNISRSGSGKIDKLAYLMLPLIFFVMWIVKPNQIFYSVIIVALTASYLALTSKIKENENFYLRALAVVGGISYGLYLWHWPVYLMFLKNSGTQLSLEMKLVILIITFMLAIVSKIVLEDKYIRIDVEKRIKFIYLSGVIMIISTLLLSQSPYMVGSSNVVVDNTPKVILPIEGRVENTQGSNSTEGKSSNQENIVVSKEGETQGVVKSPLAKDDYFVPLDNYSQLSLALSNSSYPNYKVKTLKQKLETIHDDIGYHSVAGCAGENTSCTEKVKGGKEVFLLGDSHANMWFPALSRLQEMGKYRVTSFAMPGCPPVDLKGSSIAKSIGRDKTKACGLILDKYIATIKKERPDVLILTGSINSGDATWIKGYPQIIRTLKPFVGRMIFLGDFEYGNEFVIECYSKNFKNPSICGHKPQERKQIYSERIAAEEKIIKSTGVEYFKPGKLQCSSSYCPAIVNGIVMYRDPYHLTRTYARWIGKILITELKLN